MKKVSLFVVFCFVFSLIGSAKVIYVKKPVIVPGQLQIFPPEDGTSWTNAYSDLQYAINNADANDEIWVAAGVYNPGIEADNYMSSNGAGFVALPVNKNCAFVLRPNVKIYGGFAGNETSFSQRNIQTNETILDGYFPELKLPNSNIVLFPATNLYHVVISSGNVGNAVLDGFTIQGGKANGTGYLAVNGTSIPKNVGGGICLIVSSPTLKNLKIINNSANADGGGIYANSSNSHIINTIIKNNTASGSSSMGGGLYALGSVNSNFMLTNVEISNNTAVKGGGVAALAINMTLTNNTIAGNYASTSGNGIYFEPIPIVNPEVIKIRNSIIYGNTGSSLKNYGLDVSQCYYSLVEGLTTAGSNNNLNGNTYPMFETNSYIIQSSSPCAKVGKMSYFWSGQTPDLSAIVTDILGWTRIGNMLVEGSGTFDQIRACIDLGAYQVTIALSTGVPSFPKIYTPYSYFDNEVTVEHKIELNVFPNPVSGNHQVNISLGKYDKSVDVSMYSLDGKLIHSKNYNGNNFSLDITDLASGMYMINVRSQEGEMFTKKILVN